MYDVKSALLEKNKRRNKVTENCYSQTTELVAVVPKAQLCTPDMLTVTAKPVSAFQAKLKRGPGQTR